MADISGYVADSNAAAQAAYERALAGVAKNKASAYQQYGFNADGTLDSNNSYGLYQQTQKKYADALSQTADQYGITVGADGKSWSVNQNSNGELAQLIQQKQKAEFNSGLGVNYGADGKPADLTLSGQNQYGDYERLLGNAADSIASAEDSSRARGLGGHGLGAQAGQQLRFGMSGQLQDYRSNLLDTLTQNVMNQQSTTKNIGSALDSIDYGKKQDTYSLMQQLNQMLQGYDQEGNQALSDRDSSMRDAALQDALSRIANGDFSAAPSDTGSTPPPATTVSGGRPTAISSGAAVYMPPSKTAAKKVLPNAYLTNPNKRG